MRNFLGSKNEDGEWEPLDPDPRKFYTAKGAHARGSVLVAAVFRAFLTIYENRVRDLFRIASNGSGVLRDGEIDPDLKRRLAAEAAQCARRVMRICIRAMDYVPPVNLDFGSYLRALLTADHDLFPDDKQGYRDAFVEAFAAWGILPRELPVLSIEALLWPTLTDAENDRIRQMRHDHPDIDLTPHRVSITEVQGHIGMMLENPRSTLSELAGPLAKQKLTGIDKDNYENLIDQVDTHAKFITGLINDKLRKLEEMRAPDPRDGQRLRTHRSLATNFLEVGGFRDRHLEFEATSYYKRLLWLVLTANSTPRFGALIGIDGHPECPATVRRSQTTGRPSLHVRSVRIAKRVGQRGQLDREYVIELIQTRRGYLDPDRQAIEDARNPSHTDNYRDFDFKYRAGTTFLIDARTYEIRRLIRTPYTVSDERGLLAHRAHLTGEAARPNNAFFEGNTAGAEAAFTDLHRSEEKKDHFG